MPTPASLTLNAGAAVNVSIDVPSVAILAYHIWLLLPGSAQWQKIGEGVSNDDVRDRFVIPNPPPSGSRFAVSLAIGGHPHSPWTVDITIDQPGLSGTGASWSETGVLPAGSKNWATDLLVPQVEVA